MANSWFRLYAEFANDAKVQMLSETDQRRLVMLFCLRCNGDETLQDEQVAFQLRISNDEWQSTKALFVTKGFINSDNEVLNWDKRQYISDSSTERVAKYREKKKQECNVSVTPPDTDTEQIHKKHKDISGLALLVAMGVPEGLAKDWLKVRKLKKAAPNQTAFNSIKKHAEANGYTFVQAVQIATENNWAGFKVEWIENAQTKQGIPTKTHGVSVQTDDAHLINLASLHKISTAGLTKPALVAKINTKLGIR